MKDDWSAYEEAKKEEEGPCLAAKKEARAKYESARYKDEEAKRRKEDDVDAYVDEHAAAFAEYCAAERAHNKAREKRRAAFDDVMRRRAERVREIEEELNRCDHCDNIVDDVLGPCELCKDFVNIPHHPSSLIGYSPQYSQGPRTSSTMLSQ